MFSTFPAASPFNGTHLMKVLNQKAVSNRLLSIHGNTRKPNSSRYYIIVMPLAIKARTKYGNFHKLFYLTDHTKIRQKCQPTHCGLCAKNKRLFCIFDIQDF